MEALGPIVPPTIDAERCVHAVSATAGCRACVDACPVFALQLDDSALRLDEGLCIGCGLCRPACPEHAIAHAEDQFMTIIDAENACAYLACVCSGDHGGAADAATARARGAVVPCLCALKEADLHRLADQGITHLYVTRGPSGLPEPVFPAVLASAEAPLALGWHACSSDVSRTTLALLELAVYRLRSPRGERRLEISVIETDRWRRQVTALVSQHRRLDENRRALFRGFLQWPSAAATQQKIHGAALARYAPVFDESACVACHACARICPHGAIDLKGDKDAPHYHIEPQACTGCGLCEDVCLDTAVQVAEFVAAAPARVNLVEGQCKRCGAPFHETSVSAAEPDGTKHCRICRGKPQTWRLFEVRS